MAAESGAVFCSKCQIVGFGVSSSVGMGGARLFDLGDVTPRCRYCGTPLEPISSVEYENFDGGKKNENIVKFILCDPLDQCYEGWEEANEKILAEWEGE